MAEAKLFKALNGEKEWAIKYTLSRLGKHRGYTERIETEEVGKVKKQVFKFGDTVIEF